MNIRRPPVLQGSDAQKLEQLKVYVGMLIEDVELWGNTVEKKLNQLERTQKNGNQKETT